MDEYVSPVDGHRHFGDAGRAECAVCRLETERDRLTEEVTTMSIQSMGVETEYHDACAERDRLRAAVEASDGPVAKTMEYLGRVEAERDRLRVVVDAAQEFDAAWSAWRDKIERGENVNSQDDESRRRAASIAGLIGALRQLDVSAEVTDG